MPNRRTECRLCSSPQLESIFDLGNQVFTGIFPKCINDPVPRGPLLLVKCAHCHLVQLAHSFDPGALYGMNYGYRSGLNRSMVRHLVGKVRRLVERYSPKAGDLVLDIGSNDSTLLQSYPPELKLVGVDPSGAKFKSFYPDHIQLIPDFFSADKVRAVLGDVQATLITSIAMFYDLEDPSAFVREVASLLTDDGVWTFEQSYLPSMLDTLSYDTICHEHLEYYGLHQVKRMLDAADLKIIDLELNDINGGSFSLSVAKRLAPYPEVTEQIERILAAEVRAGLNTLAPYQDFVSRAEFHRKHLVALLSEIRRQGQTVFGYGASTKGNVLLQYCGFNSEQIPCIAEVNEDKFGAFTPGTRIPIVSETEARRERPDYFLVLPWHFRDSILQREREFLESGGEFIFPLPRLEVVSAQGSYFPKYGHLNLPLRRRETGQPLQPV